MLLLSVALAAVLAGVGGEAALPPGSPGKYHVSIRRDLSPVAGAVLRGNDSAPRVIKIRSRSAR